MERPYAARGGALIVLDGTVRLERELRSCAHCGVLWVAGMDYVAVARSFCRLCMAPTCGSLGCEECIPAERELEMVEAAARGGLPAPVRCGHCRTVYQPVPGSGKVREWCLEHGGPLCGDCNLSCEGR